VGAPASSAYARVTTSRGRWTGVARMAGSAFARVRSSVRSPTNSAQPCCWANTSELTRTAAPNRQAGGHWFEPSTAHRKYLHNGVCCCRWWRRVSSCGKDAPCHNVRFARAELLNSQRRRLGVMAERLETSAPAARAAVRRLPWSGPSPRRFQSVLLGVSRSGRPRSRQVQRRSSRLIADN
jgi:hypothetical protein